MTRVWIPADWDVEDVLRLMDRFGVDDTYLWFHTALKNRCLKIPGRES